MIEKNNSNIKCNALESEAKVNITRTAFSNRTELRNAEGQLHRINDPAVEYSNGTKYWYQDGKCHRLDGSAIEYADGRKCWYLDDQKYSEIDYWAKVKEMTLTKTVFDNRIEWRNAGGQLHRQNDPAIEWSNGDKEWYQDGKCHRINGPAVEWSNGYKVWYFDGKLHRIDGPAVEYSDGTKKWHLDDQKYSEVDYWAKVKKTIDNQADESENSNVQLENEIKILSNELVKKRKKNELLDQIKKLKFQIKEEDLKLLEEGDGKFDCEICNN